MDAEVETVDQMCPECCYHRVTKERGARGLVRHGNECGHWRGGGREQKERGIDADGRIVV